MKMPGPPPSVAATKVLLGLALRDIMQERVEQIDVHGFTPAHDLGRHPADLARAAESYLKAAVDQLVEGDRPEDARANLVKALAIAWAAVDRLDAQLAPDGAA